MGFWIVVVGFALAAWLVISGLARPSRPVTQLVRLEGNGQFSQDIVGEGAYQAALAELCGGKTEDGVSFELDAVLAPEPDNAYDRMAVVVRAGGRTIGHLSRSDARAYLARMKALGLAGRPAYCRARIVGGWRRDRRGKVDEGHFGVKLDLG